MLPAIASNVNLTCLISCCCHWLSEGVEAPSTVAWDASSRKGKRWFGELMVDEAVSRHSPGCIVVAYAKNQQCAREKVYLSDAQVVHGQKGQHGPNGQGAGPEEHYERLGRLRWKGSRVCEVWTQGFKLPLDVSKCHGFV